MAAQSPLSTLNTTQEAVSTVQNMGGIPVTETPTSSEPAGAVVKPVSSKSGFGVNTKDYVALNPTQTSELLANMQSMIEKRTGGWHDFMSGLQDTVAMATPPRLGGPTQAMASRATTKRQEEEDVFNMRAQMASLQAQQQQNERAGQQLKQFLGGAKTTGGAGETGYVGGMPTGLQIPDYVLQQAARVQATTGDNRAAQAVIDDYIKSFGKERLTMINKPEYLKQNEFDVPGIGKVWMNAPQVEHFNKTGELPSGQKVARPTQPLTLQGAAAGAPQLRPEGSAEDIARSLGVPLTSGTRSYDKQAKMYEESQKPGYTGPVVAKPTTSRHVSGYAVDVDMDKATPEQLQALRDAGFKQTVKSEPWHWELPKTQAVAPVKVAGPAQPLPAAASQPPVQRPGEGNEQFAARLKQWEEEQKSEREIRTKGGTEYAGGVGKAEATAAAGVDDAYTTSGDRMNRSTHSLQLMDDPGVQKMVGFLEKPGAGAALLRQIRDGIAMGRLGDLNLKDIDATLAKYGATQAEIDNFNKLVNNLKTDELTEARSLLKGQGQVSDSERKLVSSMIGSISNTADALRTAIKWRQERAQLDQEMGRAFNKYREGPAGEYASFNKFMRNEGQAVIAAHNARLAKILGISPDELAGNQAYDRGAPAPQGEKPKEDINALVDRYKTKK